jgi:hypothetical protein
MEQYELAEKQILTELPQKYPKTFEIFIIFKMFLTTIFGAIFNLEITDDGVYYGMIWMWIVEFAASIMILTVTFSNTPKYSIWTAVGIVCIMQFIAFLIHIAVGHTRNYTS